jgi:transcriptional regulator with XRE-family HTH domain
LTCTKYEEGDPAVPINHNPTIRQRRLARRLRDLRVAAGLKHADVARVFESAESKISRIEGGQSGIRLPDLRALLDAYGVTNPAERADIETLSRNARKKGWWSRYSNAVDSEYGSFAAVESDAIELYNVQTSLIPGLLQTPEYTQALIELQVPDATPEHVAAQREVRAERRNVLTKPTPVQFWGIVAESVLYHQVGGKKVMSEQLDALIEDSRMPNVQLQVLPQDDPMNACLYGPFVIMSFASTAETDIVYTESPTSTVYYEETPDVDSYTTLFRRLNMAASSVTKSRALIADALKEMS